MVGQSQLEPEIQGEPSFIPCRQCPSNFHRPSVRRFPDRYDFGHDRIIARNAHDPTSSLVAPNPDMHPDSDVDAPQKADVIRGG